MVLTPSGKVLTTYQPARGTASLTAQYIVSGMTFKATVIGTDAADGLALLQLEGGDGRAFSTVQVGNSATIVQHHGRLSSSSRITCQAKSSTPRSARAARKMP